MTAQLYNLDQQTVLVRQLEIARDSRARNRGLIGHAPLGAGQGMMIKPCRWIHTFRMSFAIDVIYVGKEGRVVAITEDLPPKRIDRPVLRARFVVEMAAGATRASGLQIGHRLQVRS